MQLFSLIMAFVLCNNFLLSSVSPISYTGITESQKQLANSFWSLPTLGFKNLPCLNPKGQIREAYLTSKIYQAPVLYSIYLPPCYDDNSTDRYPVIYLLHGQTYNNEQWARLGLAELADDLINNQRILPVIIIMPNDPDWRQPGESPFGQMLVEELIPHIDATYLTKAERQYRAIGGLSRGASWALHLGLTEWKYFSKIGAHSLPVFVSDNTDIPKWLDAIPFQSIPKIYIDTGNQDPELNIARNFEKLLSSRNISHDWHMYTGTHEESYWAGHLKKYLLWYACDWTVLLYN